MKALNSVFIAVLIGISIFSSYKYFLSIKERYELINEKVQASEQAAMLQNKRLSLLQELESERIKEKELAAENLGLRTQLKSTKEEMQKLQTNFDAAQQTLEDLAGRFSVAKAENEALSRELADMKEQTAATAEEKDMLQARLNSMVELKKAIRDLRLRLSGARQEIDIRLKKDQLVFGNGGYMIKDGRPTYPTRVKIEVVPLPAQTP